jgi:hypothetical protein
MGLAVPFTRVNLAFTFSTYDRRGMEEGLMPKDNAA